MPDFFECHERTAKAFDLFNQAIQDEIGKTPKAWYEEKSRPALAKPQQPKPTRSRGSL